MSRKNYIFFFLSLIIIGVLLFWYIYTKNKNFIFEYPNINTLEFAGEKVPVEGKNYLNRERFDREYIITSNTLYQFYLYIKRYPLYIPEIEKELKKYGIPNDFKYLPIAESALRNDITSSAGASGLWQFIPDTAKRYGLEVNDFVDERYNIEKSTEAAMRYFTDLYDIFGNWTLSAAAYNRGENGIKRDLKEQGVDSYYDLFLNDETSRYVFRILAIKYLIQSYENQKRIVDTLIGGTYQAPQTKTIEVTEIPNLIEWSHSIHQDYQSIKVLNPWILGDTLPKGTWKIKIFETPF